VFREWKCGCIFSVQQGRVRICSVHRLAPGKSDGYGGFASSVMKGRTRLYPANGEMVRDWGAR